MGKETPERPADRLGLCPKSLPKMQKRLSYRQMRWMEYLAQFDLNITYVKGITNKVANALSRYYESDTVGEEHPLYEYVNVDI